MHGEPYEVHAARRPGGEPCLKRSRTHASTRTRTATPSTILGCSTISRRWRSRRRPATLGMWVFLPTEVLFFGGLFFAYCSTASGTSTRSPRRAARSTSTGRLNTTVLIGSSLTMALAVRAAQTGERAATVRLARADDDPRRRVPGCQGRRVRGQVRAPSRPRPSFVWASEHETGRGRRRRRRRNMRPPPTMPHCQGLTQIYFSLYFTMTGLHALHMIVGIGIMLVITWMAAKGTFSPGLLHAGRDGRALLALRRPRLDLPVPPAVSRGAAQLTPQFTSLEMPSARYPVVLPEPPNQRGMDAPLKRAEGLVMSGHVSPKSVYYSIFAALMALTVLTVFAATVNLGALQLPGRAGHRHHQVHARRAVLHAREVQQPPHEAGGVDQPVLPGHPARRNLHGLRDPWPGSESAAATSTLSSAPGSRLGRAPVQVAESYPTRRADDEAPSRLTSRRPVS